ncbi:deoxyribose-phosphate aldolase [Cooperia oncophora]
MGLFDQAEFDKETSRSFDPKEIALASARYEKKAAELLKDKEEVRKVIGYIDLTTLAGDDTKGRVVALVDRALSPVPGDSSTTCAAVCVYPQRVRDVIKHLDEIKKTINVAAVAAGFPSGQYHLQSKLVEVQLTVADGATEIDIVISRAAALEGEWETVYDEVLALKSACGSAHLKTILATGELKTLANVYKASWASILAGSDFIKTSTGKETTNATLEVAFVMCSAIKRWHELTGKKVGFKPAGGIKTPLEALAYVALIKDVRHRVSFCDPAMRVTFLHPDLGIGGAERLVVDAAVALQNKGHQVKIVTSQFDPNHAFKETKELDITVIQWFPRMIFGCMWAFMPPYVRMCLAAIYVSLYVDSDVIICVSGFNSTAVFITGIFASIFYTVTFPDMLPLRTPPESFLKSVYRYFLDSIEEFSTGLADWLRRHSSTPKPWELFVLYPTLNTDFFDDAGDCNIPELPSTAEHIFTSLNRFEVKKNVKLAIEAFAALRSMLSDDEFARCHLVIAGGYDRLNVENITHFKELVDCVSDMGLKFSQVTFLRSPCKFHFPLYHQVMADTWVTCILRDRLFTHAAPKTS